MQVQKISCHKKFAKAIKFGWCGEEYNSQSVDDGNKKATGLR